jgi:EmrB/QacA subfamily drug resistance transporter
VSVQAAIAGGPGIRYRSKRGRWVLFATVLGTSMAFLDATVVNIALPTIGEDLDAGLTELQWTVNAYTLALGGLLLLGGSLGDHFGRRRIFCVGAVWFAVASLACGIAPTAETLIVARALQGAGAALLTPGSLAIIEASFHRDDRGAAVGAWSGLGGIALALGPFVGGYLIDAASWRLIFLINLPIAAAVVWVATRHVPETRDESVRSSPLDLRGAAASALGLAAATYGLTAGLERGWGSPLVIALIVGGAAALVAFVLLERGRAGALVPLELFRSRQFSSANAVTFVVYAAIGGMLFLLPIQLQQAAAYSPLESGAALVPLTVVMLLLSARAGRLAQRIGPRLPMALGPVVAGAGLALLTRVGRDSPYLGTVLPGVLVFSLGVSLMVAPLTSTVLSAGGEEHAGVSAAVNNAVARIAGLIAVAVIPAAAGISATGALDASSFTDGFGRGMWIAAAVCAAGGLLAAATIRNPPRTPGEQPTPCSSCPLDAPPLRAYEGGVPLLEEPVAVGPGGGGTNGS